MIKVEDLSKYYGFIKAVNGLSFEVKKGEVLGFLGPNGAGKTTTMKILTCYLPPSSGKVSIFGLDILRDSMEVRKRIGYLPEKSPLYLDMRVGEFLDLVSKLKDIESGRIRSAIDMAVERCGLETVFNRVIGKLSKGFQQRVGIAQAIIADPELLILDEPTIGLDPRQIIDIRQLIKNLGVDRTVILSSHILPEVNQVCNRVIIINKGELVAVDTPDNLRNRLQKSSVTRVTAKTAGIELDPASVLEKIEGILRVKTLTQQEGISSFQVESTPDRDIRARIAEALVSSKIPLLELYNEELSLEDIFIKLVTEEVK